VDDESPEFVVFWVKEGRVLAGIRRGGPLPWSRWNGSGFGGTCGEADWSRLDP
jgi:hypothetical protein